MWVDSHCHLHVCEEQAAVGDLIERARAAGVDGIVTIGIDAASSERSRVIARTHDLWFSAGLHPNSATEWTTEVRGAIEGALADERCVAVGESGLDFYRDVAPRDEQEMVFRHHIEWAKTFDKALVIHTRASVDAALGVLEREGPPERLVFHCWSGTTADLERALTLGAYASFAGNVSFKNADDVRAAARLVPSDRLLVETDSPFLAPVPFRGKPNEPARAVEVGAAVARARDERVNDVAAATSGNARRLFGIHVA